MRVRNLLLGLIREVRLENSDGAGLRSSFFIGFGGGDQLLGSGFAVTWWRTPRYKRLSSALGRAIRDLLREFVHIERSEIAAFLDAALKNNPLNRHLLARLSGPERPTSLLDGYLTNSAEVVASQLWIAIVAHISHATDDWLFVYPLRLARITETTQFPQYSALIFPASDHTIHSQYTDRFPILKDLSLSTGTVGGIRLGDAETYTWLYIERSGTKETVFSETTALASALLGLILSAHWVVKPFEAFANSMADPQDYAALFSKRPSSAGMFSSHCGPLFHSTFSGFQFSNEALEWTVKALTAQQGLTTEKRRRVTVAAKWINQAAPSNKHTRFLFFFFAVDALYGERFQVEQSIVNAVRAALGEEWSQKCRWLFELRSELVHGGCASTEDWNRLDQYRDHFQSNPESDIEAIAAQCLVAFHGIEGPRKAS